MTFWTKFVEVAASPADTTCCIFFGDADAKTSAGAPWAICNANAELAAKLSRTLVPGCALSNCLAIVVNASESEAAARTVTVPDNPEWAAALVDVAGAEFDPCFDEELHPAVSSSVTAPNAKAIRVQRYIPGSNLSFGGRQRDPE
jgi:hypothetical protein